MIDQVQENRILRDLTKMFRRSPRQLNQLHGADAELLLLPSERGSCLAVTVDTIAEEIAAGLYADPYLAGWMGVMASLSDLAAVGAEPLGILISETLPKAITKGALEEIQKGIGDACARCSTHVLGGDTNAGAALSITGCAVGLLPEDQRLSRIGVRPGDQLYASGPIGTGNGFALRLYRGGHPVRESFQPVARLPEGRCLRGLATACMDSSDGILATLDQLMRLNGTGFQIDPGWEGFLDPAARGEARAVGVPAWFLLAGQHGEFELVFTIRDGEESLLHDRAARFGWKPTRLGRATRECAVVLDIGGLDVRIPTGEIRDLAQVCGGDLQANVAGLVRLHDRIMRDSLHRDDTRALQAAYVQEETRNALEGGAS